MSKKSQAPILDATVASVVRERLCDSQSALSGVSENLAQVGALCALLGNRNQPLDAEQLSWVALILGGLITDASGELEQAQTAITHILHPETEAAVGGR